MAGIAVFGEVFRTLDPTLTFMPSAGRREGGKGGSPCGDLRQLASILTAERVALNLLQRMCGIATLTRRYVDEIAGMHAKILDTRKTAPGLRILDKYAVRVGGVQSPLRPL